MASPTKKPARTTKKSSPAKPAPAASPPAARVWDIKIVGHENVAPDQLLANPFNWRIHSASQQDAMQGALETVGWLDEVMVNVQTQHMINGHMRVTLALRHGEPTVPVRYVDLTPEEELVALLTFDPLGGQAVADREILAQVLQDVQIESAVLKTMLDDLAQQSGAMDDLTPPSLDELETRHGAYNEEDFWPIIKLRLPPEIFELYTATLQACPGDSEAEKFAHLLRGAAQ